MFMSMKGLKDVPLLILKNFFKQLILNTLKKLQGSITLLLNILMQLVTSLFPLWILPITISNSMVSSHAFFIFSIFNMCGFINCFFQLFVCSIINYCFVWARFFLIVSHIAFLFIMDNSILFPLWYSPSILILIFYGVCNWFRFMYFFQTYR